MIERDSTAAVAYLRRSTDRQEQSIADQRAEITRHAEKHGYRIIAEYIDDAISGTSADDRPEFRRMIEDARAGEFKAVNGPSFTARRFVRYTKDRFSHVRIAYRTPTQLGLLERFHRTLKQEEVYWRLYDSPSEARACLAEFHQRYNTRRPHWALIPESGGDPLTPEDVYAGGMTVRLPAWQPWAKQAKEQLDQMMLRDAA